jgi:hypothetical protein
VALVEMLAITIVPLFFYGQGMNAGFEKTLILYEMMQNMVTIGKFFQNMRKSRKPM